VATSASGKFPTHSRRRELTEGGISLAGKLTARAVESLAKRKGRYGDGDGLFLRVLDPGKRVYWTFRYRMNGKDRETSVGAYPELSLAQARDRHLALRNAVKVDKTDPVGDRRAAKTAVMARSDSAKPAFGQCADQFIALNEGAWRSRKHAAQWRQSLARHCQPIWLKPVDLITAADVLAVLEPIWPTVPETASRVRGRIEKILNAARVRGHIAADKANPARWKDHLKDILPSPKKIGKRGHHASMLYAELPAFMARLAETDSITARALQLTILTACRTSEVLCMTWDEIDCGNAIWRAPASRMKMQKPHDVPLSNPALAILRAQEIGRGDNPHVFPGRPMRPLSTMAMLALLKRLGVGATVHGFRSSARSWMADTGVPLEIAEACLAHQVGNAVVQAYQRSSMLERRRPVMSAWADFVTGKTNDNVVPLRRGAASE
jgi:integrase